MVKKFFKINNIPSVLWGDKKDKVIIAVHGNMSNKEDTPIEVLAETAVKSGYQVLSFDLPEHGDRKEEGTPCKVQYCVRDLNEIMKYTKEKWKDISLFANSMGAYFSLLAYKNEKLSKAWFLSPVVDMQRIIENMMKWFNVSEEELKNRQTIPTPIGQTLYWDYYSYVKENPVDYWNVATCILYGEKDEVCEIDTILNFTDKFSCSLEKVQQGEHYFHTPEQISTLKEWLKRMIE